MSIEVSELMDGELDPQQAERALNAVGKSDGQRDAWATYHLIGDALRGERHYASNLQQRVFAALESEPTVLAPRVTNARRASWTQPRMVWAAAATVAAIGLAAWLRPAATTMPQAEVALVPQSVAPANGGFQNAALNYEEYLSAHREFSPASANMRPSGFTNVDYSSAAGERQ